MIDDDLSPISSLLKCVIMLKVRLQTSLLLLFHALVEFLV